MRKIVFVSTTNITINSFLVASINKLKKNNKIYILTNYTDNESKIPDVIYQKVKFERQINVFRDLSSLFFLIKNIFIINPHLVFTITPKAGFLGIAASFILRINIRVHIFTGQVWITKTGIIKSLLKFIDKIIFNLSTNCLIDSLEQKKFLVKNNIINIKNQNIVRVLGDGSICGVDTQKFKPNNFDRLKIRKEYSISENDKAIIFVGRLNQDKGILDLVKALDKLNKIYYSKQKIHLIIVGQDEANIIKNIKKNYSQIIHNIHFAGYTENAEKFFAASDIFCLPSYREGFGMSVIEAGSAGLPVIVSDIYGLQDSVIPDHTGYFHEVGNVNDIVEKIKYLIDNPKLRNQFGINGRNRVLEKFEKNKVINLYSDYVNALLDTLTKPKLSIVSTTQLSVEVFLLKQIDKLSEKFNITICTNLINDNLFNKLRHLYNVNYQNINIRRDIIILNDILVFFQLIYFFIFKRCDVLFTITPKAAALAQFSAFITLIKKRVHWYGGQVWATKSGMLRKFLKFIDKLIYLSCTNCLTECLSQKKFLEIEKVVHKDTLTILGNGSICGVDTNRFKPDSKIKKIMRKNLNLDNSKCIILFVGRLNIDKGILDLAGAVSNIIFENPKTNLHLMLVGPDEEKIKEKINLKYENLKGFCTFVDFTNEPEKYMTCADIFCIPSHREGFGMVALEAASSQLPVINSKIYGLEDAVEENVTSISFEVKNITDLKEKIKKLVNDELLMSNLGEQGRKRVYEKFNPEVLTSKFLSYFEKLI